ncbi:DNA alkylation repair protein [Dyadobacter sp. CY312]|uniref:DNA alkylation repair protein n=1 Tax=Dyadobacter sp. CY312 TaxID=2907303 RepID=UPI001F2E2C0D|nr:DNA alkylation repair protein [Dyadobacter sp. CY312]MCE7043278.1 DNA alkylation repair protein [Dyadobacter sp. CY312]
MKLSTKADNILKQITDKNTKLGDMRTIAKAIKRDHELALELWSSEQFFARQLAILIMDKKLLSQDVIDHFVKDMEQHKEDERLQLMDWLFANQLTKDKKTIALIESWENNPSVLLRRTFWYYQARLRWTGQTPPPNTEELLLKIENRIEEEASEVQWAMNFTAAQIGIFQEEFRTRCISLGERTGLYSDEIVAKNCTPSYLPKFIAIQVEKLEK